MASNPESSASLQLHALVIPLPLQSHIIPMMQLSQKLAATGFTVTFVTTHHTHSQITKANSNSSQSCEVDRIHLDLDIRSVQISDGLPVNFDRSARFFDHMRSLENMGDELEQLIHNLNKKGPPISCVIADPILYWSLHVAKKFGILWISFWTQSTIVYSIYYQAHLEAQNKGVGKILIDHIQGVPTLQMRDLPSFFQERDADSEYALDLVLKSLQSSCEADWILCNSFDDLESAVVNAMNLQPPVLHLGPLIPSGYLNGEISDDIRVGTSIWTEYDCSAWLDTKPKDSVLYVSFGSMIRLSKAQLEEIAMGLKESGQPFLWVLRPDIVAAASDCAALPDAFLQEMGIIGPQGLVVPWCNQLRVLSHPSVGGFITHCGWNSMLESIALGVPMLGFPVWSEQYTNCVLMADVWKIGLRLKGGSQAGDLNDLMIVREDICKAIRKLFTDEGKEMKKKVKALSESARTAILKGGSSHKNFENFVEGLRSAVGSK